MSFLIRLVNFKIISQNLKVFKEMTLQECQVTFFNLRHESRFMYSKIAETMNISISNARIQNYLNFLSDAYKNKHNRKWNQSNLTEIINSSVISEILKERINILENINHLNELVEKDTEMKKLSEEEWKTYKDHLNDLDERLLETILRVLGNEMYENIIMEITAGVGGQEAMLFAKELCEMYEGYADYLGLKCELLEFNTVEQGGIRNASLLFVGSKAFEKMRHEGGVHRVQRVPITETGGRVHTSTATVVILPEPTEVEIIINDKDLKVETKRASGAGGQHVNTTDSAIRITHLPTGISVTSEAARSQISNKKIALMKLRSILYEEKLNKQTTALTELRKKQMDHRLDNGTIYNLKEFMKGGAALEELEDKLQKNMQRKLLLELMKKLEYH